MLIKYEQFRSALQGRRFEILRETTLTLDKKELLVLEGQYKELSRVILRLDELARLTDIKHSDAIHGALIKGYYKQIT